MSRENDTPTDEQLAERGYAEYVKSHEGQSVMSRATWKRCYFRTADIADARKRLAPTPDEDNAETVYDAQQRNRIQRLTPQAEPAQPAIRPVDLANEGDWGDMPRELAEHLLEDTYEDKVSNHDANDLMMKVWNAAAAISKPAQPDPKASLTRFACAHGTDSLRSCSECIRESGGPYPSEIQPDPKDARIAEISKAAKRAADWFDGLIGSGKFTKGSVAEEIAMARRDDLRAALQERR